ncbi:MAG: flagellar hook assembly protein FlgD [Vulcanimicrobiota bacterium]
MNVASAIGTGLKVVGALGEAKNATKSNEVPTNMNFLDMLVTQLTHQNPLEPMDNNQMISQMAQFNTVDKLENLNQKMEDLLVYQNMVNSSNLIGKEVVVFDDISGEMISGKVESIKVEQNKPSVVVDGITYDIANIQDIK